MRSKGFAACSNSKWAARLSLLVAGAALTVAGCFPPRTVALPTRGRVYFERETAGARVLQPAAGVLVLAERLDVCHSRPWMLASASSTGIDAFLRRTDEHGYFTIPARRERICSRAIIVTTAFVPGFSSLGGRVALDAIVVPNQTAYSGLWGDDAILLPRAPTPERAAELARDLHATDSHPVTQEMGAEILDEMRPEIVQLKAHSGGAWERECRRWGVCD